jgi:hypothetical protein
MAQLRFIDDAGQIRTKTLDAEACLVGRATTCQIVFVDDTVSREHARIELDSGGRFRVKDLGSRNKTFVNGELITETFLTGGDIVRAGARVMEFLDEAPPREKIDLEFLTPDRTEPPNSEWLKLKAPLSLNTGQIERLAAICTERRMTARAEDIAGAALGQILLDLQAERGFVALRGDAKTELSPLAHRGLKRPSGGSLTPVSHAFVSLPLLQGVAGRYPQSTAQLNLKLGYAAAGMVTALLHQGETLGVLYVDRPMPKKPFTSNELHYLIAAGVYVGNAVAEATHRLVRDASRETAAWIGTLRRVQATLGQRVQSSASFAAAVKLYSGRARCGDFAELVHLDEQRCALLAIDAGGHGVAGMAQAAALRAAVRAGLAVAPDTLLDAGPLLGALNAFLAGSSSRQVVPTVYVGIDLSAGKLVYVNAGGMAPLLMVGPGRLLTLDQTALVLGVDAEQVYEGTRVDLPETFRLVCHTDGLVEACNSGGEALGPNRIHEALLVQEAFGSVQDALGKIDSVWTAHLAGTQPDDDALVVVLGRG